MNSEAWFCGTYSTDILKLPTSVKGREAIGGLDQVSVLKLFKTSTEEMNDGK